MKKLIIAFILGGVVFGSITGVVAYNYNAKDVSYTPTDSSWNVNNVSDAIKDLKTAKEHKENGVEVARLTTQGATYTMQNNGYIKGTVQSTDGKVATLKTKDYEYILSNNSTDIRNISVFIENGKTVTTRTDGGSYNLTVYEWK